MIDIPLIRDCSADAVFAYRDGPPTGVDEFLRDVAQLAALLPERQYILNLCSDRYQFTVGFAAALLRRQISLLPPNQTPDMIGQVNQRYPDVYCLTDAATGCGPLERGIYPRSAGQDPAVPPAPAIPAAQAAAILITAGSTGPPVPNRQSRAGPARRARAGV